VWTIRAGDPPGPETATGSRDLGKRIAIFVYGSATYALFLGVFLYSLGFIGNFGVPKSIDSVRTVSIGLALVVNLALLMVFAVQHSVMARPAFKRWWTRFVPHQAERSTYVLFTCFALILIFWLWQPMGGVIWDIQHPVGRGLMWGLFAFGWGLVLVSTFLINHFDLFGLRQIWLYLRGKPYTPLHFVTPGPYRLVRHPLYVGWFFAFWATPTMTIAHLVFALMTTAYMLVAIQFEERDLIAHHGRTYADYRRRVPMLVPRLRRGAKGEAGAPESTADVRAVSSTSARTMIG
jgi:protein-S-isoprenylcysteine O-methyltransferase Ste14